ncbi:phosphoethanolamine transferase [Agarivorans sp. QJM3NY_33]|uniref:phosphoethanolamine transferase n=1 Tax=Agarivorans sp. QJM3NY_33 TaxID=3421432 RepID=UPI003D7C87C9
MRSLTRFALPYWLATLFIALYFAVVLNLPIYAKISEIFSHLEQVKLGFIISIPLFFVLALNLIFQLFSWPLLFKPFFILLILLSSIVSYSSFNYGTIFDQDMLVNILETNAGEASSYISLYSLTWILGLGVLPSVLLALLPIKKERTFIHFIAKKCLAMILSVLGILLIAALYYQDYSSVGRNNSYLNKMIIPTQFVYSAYGQVKDSYFTKPMVYKTLATDAKQIANAAANTSANKPNLVIFLLGETARAQNYQYHGYARDTNAYTQAYHPFFFSNMSSCGTATAVSVPCLFSNMNKANFNRKQADHQDNLLDILQRAGINLLWKENDGGDKAVAKNIPLINIDTSRQDQQCNGHSCYDMVLLENLDQQISAMSGNRMIVMHLMGSHGPTYFQRYPSSMATYQPDCPRADIENCSIEQIQNSYDNSIRYTDFVTAQVIKHLQSLQQYNTALIYVSDHGESLGENGLFLHGMPYSLAPETQTKVPLLFWMSPGFAKQKHIDSSCLNASRDKPYSHDNLFHSLLGLMDVSTQEYHASEDIFSPCRSLTNSSF